MLKRKATKPLGDDLDPGIRETVKMLRRLGWNTVYSCQGGEGHADAFPTIELDLQSADDAERLASDLSGSGHCPLQIEVTIRAPADGFWSRHARVTLGTIMPLPDRHKM